jgi:hypothetical protein
VSQKQNNDKIELDLIYSKSRDLPKAKFLRKTFQQLKEGYELILKPGEFSFIKFFLAPITTS